jgi:hypothetical protein
MAAKIKLTITTSSPTSFCNYLQLLFQEPSPVLDSSRSYPIDPLGGLHQILLTAMMATAFCQTTPHPLGDPAYRRCSKLTKTRELHLSTIGPSIPKNFLFPQTRHLFGPTPQTLIQAAAFLEQIKSACSLSLEFQRFQDVASSGQPHANSRGAGSVQTGKQVVRFQHSPSGGNAVHHPGNRLCQSGYMSVPPDNRVPAPDKDPKLTF